MTLRSFHLFFITISVLLTLFVGIFEWGMYHQTKGVADLVISVGAFAASIGLAIYGFRFRAKTAGAGPFA